MSSSIRPGRRLLVVTKGVGAIVTRGAPRGAMNGGVPGTLSFDAIQRDHPRSAQLAVPPPVQGRPLAGAISNGPKPFRDRGAHLRIHRDSFG